MLTQSLPSVASDEVLFWASTSCIKTADKASLSNNLTAEGFPKRRIITGIWLAKNFRNLGTINSGISMISYFRCL